MFKMSVQYFILIFCLIETIHAGDTSMLLGSPAGKFYEVDQHRMHIECSGESETTIIVDSGIGGSSIEWSMVRDILENGIRFCTYDRSGYGWSDPGASKRTTENISSELHELLHVSGQKPPYVFIGHSFGGFTARYFSYQYPNEVIGLILIESSHPDQAELMGKLKTGSNKRTTGVNPLQLPHKDFINKLAENRRLQAGFLNSRRKAIFSQMDEIKYFQTSANQVKEAFPIPEIPIVVITHGKKIWPLTTEGQEMERIWTNLQQSLTELTNQGEHIIAKNSGHNVHLDEPELIANTIKQLLHKLNKGTM